MHTPRHRSEIRINFPPIIEYLWYLNIGLACGVIFCITAELLRAVA